METARPPHTTPTGSPARERWRRWFRAILRERGLSAKDVADALTRAGYPVSQAGVGRWRVGALPNLDYGWALAAVLGVSHEELLRAAAGLDAPDAG